MFYLAPQSVIMPPAMAGVRPLPGPQANKYGTGNVISTTRNASTGLCTTIDRRLDYVLPRS
jgi:hypothetical protein